MKIGIVGHEAAKFTEGGKALAIAIIHKLLTPDDSVLVSGHCHLGGIDLWAEDIATMLGRRKIIHAPQSRSWERGYKPRNELIARDSEVVHCIVVSGLPASYSGMRFESCYHCKTNAHVKSGGCWTAKRAQSYGKPAQWHIIKQGP